VCEEATIVTDVSADVAGETSREALAAERLRSTRYLGVFRFVGVTIAFAMNGIVPHLLPAGARYQSDVRLFACYWIVAAAIFWTTRRGTSPRRFAGLAVAPVHMPFALLLQDPVAADD